MVQQLKNGGYRLDTLISQTGNTERKCLWISWWKRIFRVEFHPPGFPKKSRPKIAQRNPINASETALLMICWKRTRTFQQQEKLITVFVATEMNRIISKKDKRLKFPEFPEFFFSVNEASRRLRPKLSGFLEDLTVEGDKRRRLRVTEISREHS